VVAVIARVGEASSTRTEMVEHATTKFRVTERFLPVSFNVAPSETSVSVRFVALVRW
jgi:RNA 3'-terminal phosphate cyclase